jgi:hypothetical protein
VHEISKALERGHAGLTPSHSGSKVKPSSKIHQGPHNVLSFKARTAALIIKMGWL